MGGEKASEREYRLGIISSGCLHLPEPVHAYFVQCVCTHTHTHTCRVKWGMAEVGRKFMENVVVWEIMKEDLKIGVALDLRCSWWGHSLFLLTTVPWLQWLLGQLVLHLI